MATLIGQTLGQYQIIERLGRGGMAEVYKAFHPKLERFAAIKVLHGFLAEGEDFLARFQREAKAIAALSHPNIVKVYDFDTSDDLYYMVIEFIDGGTLKDRLMRSDGPLPFPEMTRILRETASALDYAHQKGVLHRDIKPTNVLIDKAGRAVITDFGIARIISDTRYTATGDLIGTPAYMSPEQGLGLKVTEASDIYALGIVLYEMVTGRVPFEADTPFGVIHKHIHDPLPLPSIYRENIPGSIEVVILKALEKDPLDRYQTPSEMAAALDEAILQIAHQETLAASPKLETPTDPVGGEAETIAIEPAPRADPASTTIVAAPSEEAVDEKDTAAAGAEAAAEIAPETKAKTEAETETEAEAEAEAEVAVPASIKAGEEPKPKASPASKKMGPMDAAVTPSHRLPARKSRPKPARARERKPKQGAARRRVKPLPLILGVVALGLIAALLVWGLPMLIGGEAGGCDSIEECMVLAEERWNEGDLDGAISAIDEAIDFVPESEHQYYAHLWCQRGEALIEVTRLDDAASSFEACQVWIGDDPDQEDLRTYAQERIDTLTGQGPEMPREIDCDSPEHCHAMAEELFGSGNIDGAIQLIDRGVELVPEGQHPHHHYLMCTMGEIHAQIDKPEEAIEYFEECIRWTGDEPGLESVRTYAQEQIDILLSR